jgi:hypothetical protein
MITCKESRTSPFLGRSPDGELRGCAPRQLDLAESGIGVPTINQTVSTLRFF